ncbi:hypothetical protein GOODEAATRI_009171 [Goodea atripinnis]|uniref:Uncharacterized protein n=1 Tax=Goodea atripinnis TaxID=208336 RepID=A0ABV0MGA8_9TELE
MHNFATMQQTTVETYLHTALIPYQDNRLDETSQRQTMGAQKNLFIVDTYFPNQGHEGAVAYLQGSLDGSQGTPWPSCQFITGLAERHRTKNHACTHYVLFRS